MATFPFLCSFLLIVIICCFVYFIRFIFSRRMEHSVCRFCGKAFGSKSGVLQHEKTHRDEGPYKCCGKVFFSNANKTRHSCNVHGEEKQFQCSNCDKKFATKTDMERHKKREGGDFKFNCDICGAKESSKDKLEDHMGSHSGLKRHTCQICHKTFRYSGNLSRHRKTHEVQDEDELNNQ